MAGLRIDAAKRSRMPEPYDPVTKTMSRSDPNLPAKTVAGSTLGLPTKTVADTSPSLLIAGEGNPSLPAAGFHRRGRSTAYDSQDCSRIVNDQQQLIVVGEERSAALRGGIRCLPGSAFLFHSPQAALIISSIIRIQLITASYPPHLFYKDNHYSLHHDALLS